MDGIAGVEGTDRTGQSIGEEGESDEYQCIGLFIRRFAKDSVCLEVYHIEPYTVVWVSICGLSTVGGIDGGGEEGVSGS